MNEQPRLIKQPARDAFARISLETQAFAPATGRIPGRQVAMAKQPPPDAPAWTGRSGIIRKDQAHVTARDVEIALPELVPDVLPDHDAPGTGGPEAPPEPAPLSDEAREAAWQARLDEAVARARQEGFDEGVAAVQAEMQDALEAARGAFLDDVARLEAAVRDFFSRTEPLMATLAFEIAETILNAPLPGDIRHVAGGAITEAVERATGESSVDVTLHPVDYLRLQESGLVDQLNAMHSGLRWHPSPDARQGDWVVQSPVASTRRLESELLATLKQQLGLGKDEGRSARVE